MTIRLQRSRILGSTSAILAFVRRSPHDRKRVLENICSLSALQAINYLLPLLTLPYLVRVLGVETFGLVAFAQAFVQYFVVITDYGFDLSATRDISIHRADAHKVSHIYTSVLTIKLLLLASSLLLYSVLIFSVARFRSEWHLYLASFGLVFAQALFPTWLYQGIERMRQIVFLNIGSRLFYAILIFTVVTRESDYVYVPLITAGGSLIAGAIAHWYAFRAHGVRFVLPSGASVRSQFLDSSPYFLSRAFVSIYTSSNAFVLGLLASHSAVGYYSAAERVYLAFQSLFQPIINALYPHMALHRDIVFFKKVLKISVFMNTLACILLFFSCKALIPILFGGTFNESVLVLQIFSIALLFLTPAVLLGYPFLAALGLAHVANGSAIAASLFHLSGLAALSATFISGPTVAALVVITTLFLLGLRIHGVRRHNLWSDTTHKER